MSAQINTGYVPSARDFETRPQPERKVSDVESEVTVLHNQAEAVIAIANEFEKRLACVLPPSAPEATAQAQPKQVRVPLAEMIGTANEQLHYGIVRLNDILARIELPE